MPLAGESSHRGFHMHHSRPRGLKTHLQNLSCSKHFASVPSKYKRPSLNSSLKNSLNPAQSPKHPVITEPHNTRLISSFPLSKTIMPSRGAHSGRGARGDDKKRNSRPPQSREITISKNLSFLLRHHAADEGITLDEGGWANVADVVSWRGFFNVVLVLFILLSIY